MELIQYAFVAALVGVLLVASVSFVVMGASKVRRRGRLARQAHERGLKFFQDDPYDVPRRYADFAVISSGHGPRANNVTAGGVEGRNVRSFDFRCELGHGTRRLTRRYSVAVAQARVSGNLLMWHVDDGELAPLVARDVQGRVGQWNYRGPIELARAVEAACEGFQQVQPCIEIRGSVVMVAAPVTRAIRYYALAFDDVSGIMDAVDAAGGGALAVGSA